jgi:chromosome segregation ATPase
MVCALGVVRAEGADMTAAVGATIEQRVDRLEAQMVRSNEDTRSISDTVSKTLDQVKILRRGQSNLEARVGMLSINLRTLTDEVAVLKTDVSDLKTDVSDLKTDVSDLKTDVSDLKTDVSDLKTDVSDLKTDVSEVKEDLSGVKADVGWLRRAMQTVLDRGGLSMNDLDAPR